MMAKVQDCNILGNKFELQLYYYIQFWINIRKGTNSLILTTMGQIISLLFNNETFGNKKKLTIDRP